MPWEKPVVWEANAQPITVRIIYAVIQGSADPLGNVILLEPATAQEVYAVAMGCGKPITVRHVLWVRNASAVRA